MHPDLIYSLNSEIALKEAEKASALLSKSYNILINDYERGKYLVSLKNLIPAQTPRDRYRNIPPKPRRLRVFHGTK